MFVILVLISAIGVGCSSSSGGGTGDICSQQGKCSGEGPPSSQATQQCEQQISDAKCGGANKAFYQCAFDKEACLPSGGFDPSTTIANCNTQYQAVKSCYATASFPVNGTPSDVPVSFQERLQERIP